MIGNSKRSGNKIVTAAGFGKSDPWFPLHRLFHTPLHAKAPGFLYNLRSFGVAKSQTHPCFLLLQTLNGTDITALPQLSFCFTFPLMNDATHARAATDAAQRQTDDSAPAPQHPLVEQPFVHKVKGLHALVIRILAFCLRMWARTLRFVPMRDTSNALTTTTPGIYLLWHNRLFLTTEINRRYRRPHAKGPMHGLVSASKDGAYLSYFFERVNISPLRGSSSRRGAQALREILEVLDKGGDIGITPDGPRGPCYDFKLGTVLLMRKTPGHIVMLGARFTHALRLKSWDGFYIPLPFSKVYLDYELIENAADFTKDHTDSQTAAILAEKMRKLNPDS